MKNDQFRRNFAAILKRAGDKADLVVRQAALDLQSSMISMSPEDTGRFKGNWQCGIGALNTDNTAPAGADAQGKTAAALQGWKAGQTIWLTNSMPYARKLEYGEYGNPKGSANGPKTQNGFSSQAPGGMVRLTVQAYGKALKKAVAELK